MGLCGSVANINLKDWDLIAMYKGLKLGICSGGDPGAKKPSVWLDNAVNVEECDIIVIASRSSGQTLKRLYGYKGYEVIEVNKFGLTSQSSCLKQFVPHMLDYSDYLNAAEIAKLIEIIIMHSRLCAVGCCGIGNNDVK